MEKIQMFIWIIKFLVRQYWLVGAVVTVAAVAITAYDKKTGKISKALDL